MSNYEEKFIKDLICNKARRKKLKKMESLLKEWYGEDLGRQEITSYLPKPQHVKNALDNILKDAVGPNEYKLMDLQKNWGKLVGEDVSKNSKPVSIKNKVLNIEVSNAIWLMQLKNFYSKMIEKKIKSFCGNNFCNKIFFVPSGKN